MVTFKIENSEFDNYLTMNKVQKKPYLIVSNSVYMAI